MPRAPSSASVVGDFGRYAGGGLLVLSAVLKHLFPDYASHETALVPSSGWYAVLTAGELALGLAVLFRLFHGVETVVALIAYSTFAAVNGWSVSAGRDTCGCLGSVTVSPAVMLALDMALAISLATQLWTRGVAFGVRWKRAAVVYGVALGLIGAEQLAGGRAAIPSALSGQPVSLDPPVVELGDRRPDEVVDVTLRLTNRSAIPVRVVGLSESKAVSLPAVAPGAGGEVVLTVTAKGAPGRRLANAKLYVDHGGKLVALPLTVVWVVSDR